MQKTLLLKVQREINPSNKKKDFAKLKIGVYEKPVQIYWKKKPN